MAGLFPIEQIGLTVFGQDNFFANPTSMGLRPSEISLKQFVKADNSKGLCGQHKVVVRKRVRRNRIAMYQLRGWFTSGLEVPEEGPANLVEIELLANGSACTGDEPSLAVAGAAATLRFS